jgi:hypothetical protein
MDMNLNQRCLLQVCVSAVSLAVGVAYAQAPSIASQGIVLESTEFQAVSQP